MQSVYSDLNARKLGSSAANLRLLQALADGACSEFVLPVLSVVLMQCAVCMFYFRWVRESGHLPSCDSHKGSAGLWSSYAHCASSHHHMWCPPPAEAGTRPGRPAGADTCHQGRQEAGGPAETDSDCGGPGCPAHTGQLTALPPGFLYIPLFSPSPSSSSPSSSSSSSSSSCTSL